MQAGSTQWWQEVVTVCWAGASAVPPWSNPTERHISSSSRPFRLWQAATQALQPVQASRSTSKAYCWPGRGRSSGIRSR
jgi:hypothetical protein